MRRDADSANVRLPPPLIYLVVLISGIVAGRLLAFPKIGIDPQFQTAIGLAIATLGLCVIFSGAGLFLHHRTAIIPHKPATSLVRSGIYRWTRNPMYLGMALLYCGVAVLEGSILALLLLPVALLLIQTQVIAKEEAYLERRFGDQYRDYRARVRRWF